MIVTVHTISDETFGQQIIGQRRKHDIRATSSDVLSHSGNVSLVEHNDLYLHTNFGWTQASF